MEETVLFVNNVCRKFGKKEVLNGISFSLCSGTSLGIIGRNGSGKTTLMNVLRGLSKIDSGKIEYFGIPLSEKNPFGEKCASVNDTSFLDEDLTGREAVVFCAEMHQKTKSDAKNMLEKCRCDMFCDEKIKKYSLGMKKRIMVACALVTSPDILLLDEATSALDAEFLPHFRKLMAEYLESGKSIIMCDHSLYEMQKICTHISFLENGKLTEPKCISDILGEKSLEEVFIERIGETFL